jgi:hypothetical protein
MHTLTGIDGTFLHLETPQTPMHVASLSLFDLPPATGVTSTPWSSARSASGCTRPRC